MMCQCGICRAVRGEISWSDTGGMPRQGRGVEALAGVTVQELEVPGAAVRMRKSTSRPFLPWYLRVALWEQVKGLPVGSLVRESAVADFRKARKEEIESHRHVSDSLKIQW